MCVCVYESKVEEVNGWKVMSRLLKLLQRCWRWSQQNCPSLHTRQYCCSDYIRSVNWPCGWL